MKASVLLIQFGQLGDILLTTPCARALRRAYQDDLEILFLSFPLGKKILEGNPDLDMVYYLDPSCSWRQQWLLVQKLRQKSISCVIDFMNTPRSALWSWLSGAQKRVAFESARKPFYTHTVRNKSPETLYIVQEKFLLIDASGFDVEYCDDLVLPVSACDHAWAEHFLATQPHGDLSSWRVVLAPTHKRGERQWPLEYYAELAQWLVEQKKAWVSVAWGPGEEEFIDRFIAMCPVPVTKFPETSFRQLAALIARHHLFIGNSNGPSHIAVAMNVASIQLHGPTLAASWCPKSARHRAVQAPNGMLKNLCCGEVQKEVEALLNRKA